MDDGDGMAKCRQSSLLWSIEINKDNNSLDIFPYSPIPSNKDSYAVVFKVFNPRKSGLFQFHTYGQYMATDSVSSYLGSYTLVID